MKKLISLILALCMAMMLVSAVAETATDSLAGTWYISRGQVNGTDVQVVSNDAICVTLNDDKTFTISSMGITGEGTWAETENGITMTAEDGSAQEFQIADGEMVYDVGNAVIYLSRTPADPAVLPAAVAAESAEAFFGTWVPVAQLASGLLVELSEEEAAMLGKVRIEEGKLNTLYDDGQGGVNVLGSNDYTFEDGVLTAEDNTTIPTKLKVSLLENGSLYYEASMQLAEDYFYTMTVIYDPAAAE